MGHFLFFDWLLFEQGSTILAIDMKEGMGQPGQWLLNATDKVLRVE